MSALSPSPVFTSPSPRTAPAPAPYHHHHHQSAFRPRAPSYAPSPRSSATKQQSPSLVATTTSPALHAAHARFSPASNVSPKHPRPAAAAEGAASIERRPRYADAGTQYSPDGYPPTAGQSVSAEQRHRSLHPIPGASKKRKEGASSPSPHMSPATLAANAAVVPPEPSLRVNPNEANGQPQPDSRDPKSAEETTTGTPPEPQEARSTHGHSSTPKRPKAEPGAAKIMPRAYETCNPKDLGVLIASMLMELIRLNDQIPLRDGRLTRFHSRAPPGISVADYLQRLIQHATLSPPILLSMVYYIDRLCALYSAFTINSLTVHRFLITAATVAAKGLSDSFWTNPTYARIGGIPVSELATLEMEFLQKVQWKIVPKPETLEDYYNSLVGRTDGYQLEARSTVTSAGSSMMDESSEREDEDQEMRDPT